MIRGGGGGEQDIVHKERTTAPATHKDGGGGRDGGGGVRLTKKRGIKQNTPQNVAVKHGGSFYLYVGPLRIFRGTEKIRKISFKKIIS